MIWKLCLFCQKHSKQNLTSLQYITTNKDIVAVAQFDPVMRVHAANEHDLIAAEPSTTWSATANLCVKQKKRSSQIYQCGYVFGFAMS